MHMYTYTIYVPDMQKVRYPRIGYRNDCNTPYVCWKLNIVPFQEPQKLLTIETSLYPNLIIFTASVTLSMVLDKVT